MKWTHATGLLATFAMIAAGSLWACSNNNGGNDGGTNDGGGNDVNQQPDTGNKDSGPTGDGGDGGVTLSCDSYCTAITSACTGANQQYIDKANCMEMCAKIPVGTSADTSGDTLGCRTYHVGVAASSSANAAIHCPHAGPYGFGGCGDLCPDFCARYAGQCDITTGWGGATACPTTCETVAGSDAGTGAFDDAGPVASGNTMECREYHLEAAYTIDGGGPHCSHASATSSTGGCQ